MPARWLARAVALPIPIPRALTTANRSADLRWIGRSRQFAGFVTLGQAGRNQLRANLPQAEKRPNARSERPPGKTKARHLHLTEDVHDRLWFLARQRKQSVSAVANDLLDRALRAMS